MDDSSLWLNAAIGAVVGLLTFFIPFSPALGGAVAGYLHNEPGRAGAVVGGVSGGLAAIPGTLVLFLGASVFLTAGITTAGPRAGLVGAVLLLLFVALVVAVYTVALGAVGGWVGAFARDEYDLPPPGEL